MMMLTGILSLAVVVCLPTVHSKDVPDFIHVCKRSDPQLENCIIKAVSELKPQLVHGVPEFSLPSLEPLVLKDLISEEAAGMKLTTTNVNAYGCSDFIMKNVQIDLDKHFYKLFIDIPQLRIEADYSVDGKILLLPIRGNGNLEANVTGIESVCNLQAELYDKDGETYMRYIGADLTVKIGGGNVRIENLFNGDKILLGMMNEVVNKNLDAFLKELLPPIQKGLARTFLEISNSIVTQFTLDQLFPK